MSRSLDSPARILSLYRGLKWEAYHSNGPDNTLLSQGYILETSPSIGMVGKNMYSKDCSGSKVFVIDWVQLKGQPAVMSSSSFPTVNIEFYVQWKCQKGKQNAECLRKSRKNVTLLDLYDKKWYKNLLHAERKWYQIYI